MKKECFFCGKKREVKADFKIHVMLIVSTPIRFLADNRLPCDPGCGSIGVAIRSGTPDVRRIVSYPLCGHCSRKMDYSSSVHLAFGGVERRLTRKQKASAKRKKARADEKESRERYD